MVGNPGSIKVSSSPSGAKVYLAEGDQTNILDESVEWGDQKGVTPLTITGITQGRTHTIKVFLENYIPSVLSSNVPVPVEGYPFIGTVIVNPGQQSDITVNFTPMTGYIKVNSNEAGSKVFIDNIEKGLLENMPSDGYNIPTGTHTVQVTKNNFIPYETNVEIGYGQTVTVEANLSQTQSLTALINLTPSSGQPPLEVHFTGKGVGPAGTNIASYHWDFGDGNYSSEQNPSHTYKVAGQYKATLTVTDQNDNTASNDVYVNVMSGDQLIVTPASGCLTISSDSAMEETGSMTYTGSILLNGFLRVTDSIRVQDGPSGAITGTGDIITGVDTIDSATAAINTGKSFTIKPKASDVGGCYREITFDNNPSSFSFTYSGLRFEVSNLKLYSNRLALAGKLSSLGGLLPEVGLGMSVSSSGFDFGGRIKLPEFKIQSFGIKDAYLELDLGCGNCWGAGITFQMPPAVKIEVGGEIGIREGNLYKILAKAAGLKLPIGNTPVFLDSISGGLQHFLPEDPDPLILSAGAGFYAGPEIPIPSLNLFNGALQLSGGNLHLLGGDVNLIVDCSGKFSAQGIAYLLDKDFCEIGSAEIIVDLNKGFYVQGQCSNPPGDFAILKGSLAGKLDFDLEFQASVAGTLQVPEALPIIGGMHFGQAAGYIDNDLIAAGVKLGDWVCVLPVCLIFSFDDPGFEVATNWDAIEEVSLTSLPNHYAYQAPIQFASVGLPLFSLAQSHRNPAIEQVFDLPEGLEVVIFHVQGATEGVLPEFTVTSPDGMIYEPGRDIALWQGNKFAGELWCAVPHPLPGNWIVKPKNLLTEAEYSISVFKLNKEPEMEFITPVNEIIVEKGTQIPITWKAEDPDSEAMIRLCYTESPLQQMENGQPTFPGNTIVKNISEDNSKNTYAWDTKGVAPGQYYIYGVITDGKNFPIFAWSEGSVTILDSTFLPPKGVKAYHDGDGIKVEWSDMPGAAGYHVYYQEIDDKTPLNLSSSLAIWEENEAEIRNIESGKIYRIAVTAFNEDGFESDYSKPLEVICR